MTESSSSESAIHSLVEEIRSVRERIDAAYTRPVLRNMGVFSFEEAQFLDVDDLRSMLKQLEKAALVQRQRERFVGRPPLTFTSGKSFSGDGEEQQGLPWD